MTYRYLSVCSAVATGYLLSESGALENLAFFAAKDKEAMINWMGARQVKKLQPCAVRHILRQGDSAALRAGRCHFKGPQSHLITALATMPEGCDRFNMERKKLECLDLLVVPKESSDLVEFVNILAQETSKVAGALVVKTELGAQRLLKELHVPVAALPDLFEAVYARDDDSGAHLDAALRNFSLSLDFAQAVEWHRLHVKRGFQVSENAALMVGAIVASLEDDLAPVLATKMRLSAEDWEMCVAAAFVAKSPKVRDYLISSGSCEQWLLARLSVGESLDEAKLGLDHFQLFKRRPAVFEAVLKRGITKGATKMVLEQMLLHHPGDSDGVTARLIPMLKLALRYDADPECKKDLVMLSQATNNAELGWMALTAGQGFLLNFLK